ncbi:hypothetical protein L596_006157 [Steinernema carpocapsae]|uniref:Uncharacterized protein n=1 Tax=Steinernema carpocapsae TaxID=34508 RepID=A0A4U8V197_STECR|nr:hypothetical protein L596_006157 [Steinernema carpocapsae]
MFQHRINLNGCWSFLETASEDEASACLRVSSFHLSVHGTGRMSFEAVLQIQTKLPHRNGKNNQRTDVLPVALRRRYEIAVKRLKCIF